jgi:hypothetical protein
MADMPMIISVDDHVVEPANVWIDRLPKKYHDVGPRVVRAPMGEITFVGGKLTVVPGSEGVPTDWYYEDLKRPLLRWTPPSACPGTRSPCGCHLWGHAPRFTRSLPPRGHGHQPP